MTIFALAYLVNGSRPRQRCESQKKSCRKADARDLRIAFSDTRRRGRDALVGSVRGGVQLSTEERPAVFKLRARLPTQSDALPHVRADLAVRASTGSC